MVVSLIITTYNSPNVLDLVLGTVFRQSCMPAEVIVADDGSDIRTRKIIDNWSGLLPIVVSWIPDSGFRAARSRNLALLKASGDYIIMIDGDCLLPPNFVSNHRKLARKNRVVAGGRYLISKEQTDLLLSGPFDSSRFIYRSLKFISLPLGPLRDLRPKNWQQARTCNLGLWKSDALSVDGFDECYEGWGKEDSDFVLRLVYGKKVRVRSGRLAVCVSHLHHMENSRLNLDENRYRLSSLMVDNRLMQGFAQRSVLSDL